MFERNIIDLVGFFIENVQSLYPFLGDLPWGSATGPVGLSWPIPLLPLPSGQVGERCLHF